MMSCGPDLVTDGLQLHLDAGNNKSYSGTGLVWKDLSGFNRHFTIPSGMVSNFNQKGYFYLPATSSSSVCYSQSILDVGKYSITVSAWVRVYSHGKWNNFVGNNWVNYGWLLFDDDTNWYFGCAKNGSQYLAGRPHNNSTVWTNLVGTYNSAVVRLYVNTLPHTVLPASASNFSLDTYQKLYVGGTGNPGACDLANVMIYNRALTENEIKQNYQVIKSKFDPLAGV